MITIDRQCKLAQRPNADTQDIRMCIAHARTTRGYQNCVLKTFVGTLHCALENGADLFANERQNIF